MPPGHSHSAMHRCKCMHHNVPHRIADRTWKAAACRFIKPTPRAHAPEPTQSSSQSKVVPHSSLHPAVFSLFTCLSKNAWFGKYRRCWHHFTAPSSQVGIVADCQLALLPCLFCTLLVGLPEYAINQRCPVYTRPKLSVHGSDLLWQKAECEVHSNI